MSPDARPTDPIVRPAPRVGRRKTRTSQPRGVSTALDALSAASAHYARRSGSERPPGRSSPWRLAIIAAPIVGAVLTFVVPLQYLCAATFRCTDGGGEAWVASCRKELLDFAFKQDASAPEHGHRGRRWFVDGPGEGLLRLCLRTSDRQAGVERVAGVAKAYLSKMATVRAQVLETPAESERVLSQYAAELEERLDKAQSQLEASLALAPEQGPEQQREKLLQRWEALRARFSTVREELGESSERSRRLKAEPEPAYGIVPSDMRRSVLEADQALQQDLRELEVNLTELKLQLLKVRQRSAGPVEQLVAAIESFAACLSSSEALDQAARARLDELAIEVESYGQALSQFVKSWNREFDAVKRVAVDPLSGELLDIHQRGRTRLNDFLFEAAKRLTVMRQAVQAIGENSSDLARFHVLQSNLIRRFRIAQSAHHRFEFTAGTIDARDNFQLDSALRSARGLCRRTRQRIRLIDERLEEEAAARARTQRIQDIARTERDVEQLREAADEAVIELVSLQEDLNLSAGLTEEFLRAVLRAEIAKDRMQIARADIARTQDQLADLAARRAASVEGISLDLVECGVVDGPVNLVERLGFGGLTTILTFLAIALGQWWLNRPGRCPARFHGQDAGATPP